MNSGFEFRIPTSIFYGSGSFGKVGQLVSLYGKKCLLISDHVMDRLGNVTRCVEYFKESHISYATYLGVNQEPTDDHVDEALELFINEKCDVIVALGGGSCIDTAKAISVLANNGGYIGDYVAAKRKLDVACVPLIAIPTTAGTGSEVTSVTVITNTKTNVKMMVKDPALIPTVAIADPLLTVTSPPHITANTGIDALCHAIEAFISRVSQPLTDDFALSSIRLIYENIRNCYIDGGNIYAREKMALASMQAGIAFSNASVCLIHGMSRPLGALFHIPHGVSNAMLLPGVLEFSKDNCLERLAVIGKIFDPELEKESELNIAESTIKEIKKLCFDLNIPSIKRWGIDKETFQQAIPKMASDAFGSGSPANNPKIPSSSEIMKIYHACYDYNFDRKEVYRW